MSEKTDIDELLSCYVDGEVTERQATEVKRMMLNDPKIAARVAEMQRQRQLLLSMPVESAPADTADAVRMVLERRTLLNTTSSGGQQVVGALHLMGRKLAAAAAMLALLGVLAILVYMVVMPGDVKTMESAMHQPSRETEKAVNTAAKTVPAQATMELLLRTGSPSGLNSVIAKVIESHGLWDCAVVDRQLSRTSYVMTCGSDAIAEVMRELAAVWDKADKKSLSIAAAGEMPVIVDTVTTEQVVAVLEAPDVPSRVAWARQFAEMNLGGYDSAAAEKTPSEDSSTLAIPKPSLTSPDFDKAATARLESRGSEVSLTITVVSSE